MRQQTWFLVSTALLAAALGCANPADNKPAAVVHETPAPPAEPTPVAAAGERYVIGEGSKIGFVGSKVTGSHDGGFNQFAGSIELVERDPTRSRVEVTIDATSLWADNDKLTGHLKSPDFFDVERHPQARFESTAIVAEGDGYTITGNLDLHGVTKNISFPAKITLGEGQVTAEAEFSVMRFDFGIVYPGKADDLIRDEVLIRLNLVAAKA